MIEAEGNSETAENTTMNKCIRMLNTWKGRRPLPVADGRVAEPENGRLNS